MHPITPDQIETAARDAGLSMAQVCRQAGVARSIFTRWKNGTCVANVGAVNRLIWVINHGGTPHPPD